MFVLWLSRNYEIRTFHLRNGDYFVIIAFSSHSMLLRNYTKNGLLGVFTLSLISSCCLADYVKECYQSACRTCRTIIFHIYQSDHCFLASSLPLSLPSVAVCIHNKLCCVSTAPKSRDHECKYSFSCDPWLGTFLSHHRVHCVGAEVRFEEGPK